MMRSMFRRPTDDTSSDDTSSDDEEESVDTTHHSHVLEAQPMQPTTRAGVDDVVDIATTESLAPTDDLGPTGITSEISTEEHRGMMLAAVLEELSRYKAAEIINNSNLRAGSGSRTDITFTPRSPEVQQFAQTLFNQSGGILSSNGMIAPEMMSGSSSALRQQYLSGLERLSYRNVVEGTQGQVDGDARHNMAYNTAALVHRTAPGSIVLRDQAIASLNRSAWQMNNLSFSANPRNDLVISQPYQVRGHYASSFEEIELIGRGGFGRVFRTFNVLDKREYAIKKIPLSARLSERYSQGGYHAIGNILKEAQALAVLDHCNVVRYHATWIEEPTIATSTPSFVAGTRSGKDWLPLQGQLLLKNEPGTSSLPSNAASAVSARSETHKSIDVLAREQQEDCEDFFERHDNEISRELWSKSASIRSHLHDSRKASTSAIDSSFFDDDRLQFPRDQRRDLTTDSSVYVLHVQMSLYPMTLSDYLSPHAASISRTRPRHCFHLSPALKILLSILCGLQYIHSRGFIHRDVKPSNIFLSRLDFARPTAFSDGYIDVGSCSSCSDQSPRFLNPRIGDFGLVTELQKTTISAANEGDYEGNKAVGTEFYRPPPYQSDGEESKESAIDEKLDVFALGVILIELLLPFGTKMERIETLRACQDGLVSPTLNQRLTHEGIEIASVNTVVDIVRNMIEPDAKKRWGCTMVKEATQEIAARIDSQQNK